MAAVNGSAPSATTPDAGPPTWSSHGIARSAAAGLPGRDELGGAPADERQSGSVEEHGRAAIELECIGPVLERDGARQPACRGAHGAGDGGAPARVATTSWLSPPARGRMPTAEKPASSSI